ncbi:MAG: hypothetical protein ABSB26_06945 [Nitrososphaerales archaeon]|jgi:hypothetical protein
MRNEAFVFVTVVLVVVSALAGYCAGNSLNQGTTITNTAFVPASCSTSVSASNAPGMIRVYKMNPGSLGVICVDYQFASAGNFSFDLGGPICVSMVVSDGLSAVYSCDLELTPSISSFDHVEGQNVTVAYLIQSDKNATGVYWFGGYCDPLMIPIAVGLVPTSVAFPGFPIPCIIDLNSPSGATVAGVTGMNVSLVPYA